MGELEGEGDRLTFTRASYDRSIPRVLSSCPSASIPWTVSSSFDQVILAEGGGGDKD